MLRKCIGFLALFCVAPPVGDVAAQGRYEEIGVTEWVNPAATGRVRQVRPITILQSGDGVIDRQEVTTNELGAAELIFYNNSRLLVGPVCEVVLDERYYDRELDVEVREFSLDTRVRCAIKADNTVSANPEDYIILKTTYGQVLIHRASAQAIVVSPDAVGPGGGGPGGSAPDGAGGGSVGGGSGGGDLGGGGGDPSFPPDEPCGSGVLYISVTDVEPGGFVEIEGGAVIRRGGFASWVDPDGEVCGPRRDTTTMRRYINEALTPPKTNGQNGTPTETVTIKTVDKVRRVQKTQPTTPKNCYEGPCAQTRRTTNGNGVNGGGGGQEKPPEPPPPPPPPPQEPQEPSGPQ